MDYSYSNQFPRKYSGFSIASVVLGILSIITWCTAIFPLPTGGLGILFAALTYRKGKEMPSLSKAGLILSVIGMIIGIILTAFIVFNFVIPLFTDPVFYEEMNEYYQSFYGISLDELLGSYMKGGSL